MRIGDLPAGAVVRDDFGCDLLVGERNGSGDINMRRPPDGSPWPCPDATTMRLVSLPDAPPPVEESAAVAHWHRKATEALAECERLRVEVERLKAECAAAWVQPDGAVLAGFARLTAERDDWQRVAGDYLNSRDQALAICREAEAERDRALVDAARLSDLMQARSADLARVAAERDDGIARTAIAESERDDARRVVDQWTARIIALTGARIGVEPLAAVRHIVTDRDECAKERDAALAENGRLRAGTVSRDAALTCIYDALRLTQAPYESSPAGALLAIRGLRAELTAHAARTQEAREMLATRDAQEGDRIAAWSYATGRAPCARCWYPTLFIGVGAPELCDACKGDDESAQESAPYVCPGCHAVGGERCAPDCIDAAIAEGAERSEHDDYEPDEDDERASAEEGDDGK
ncbi:MAG: hypothetical protein WC211_00555 [Dehalococcoidia bacterium]